MGPGGAPPDAPTGPPARLKTPVAGRVAVSVAVVVLLLAEVVSHVPGTLIDRDVRDEAARLLRVAGQEQQWGVFAPNPRGISLRIEARVTFADGSTASWWLPEGARVGANLRYYRWRKWLERVRADRYRSIWEPTARWIADELSGGTSPVARVELVRWFRDNELDDPQPPWEQHTYYALDLDAERSS